MSDVLPISAIPVASLQAVKAVLTDIDDTLTTKGRLPAVAYAALEALHVAGVLVIPVTGRPAGWCDQIARMWPVDAVVGENGAFAFRYDATSRRMLRSYAQPESERASHKEKLWRLAESALQQFPGTAIASDQPYREVDVAVDFCEDVPPQPDSVAQAIARLFGAGGAHAKVSSIHVNAWFGNHDKLTTSLEVLGRDFGITDRASVAYLGDSPNDAPMFGHFPMSIGVANVARYLHTIEHPPRYIAASEGGNGCAEFVQALLAARKAMF